MWQKEAKGKQYYQYLIYSNNKLLKYAIWRTTTYIFMDGTSFEKLMTNCFLCQDSNIGASTSENHD